MSPQADYVVSNGTGAAVRSDINGQLAAIVSNNSGATEPATTYAYMLWADTTTGLLKLRNGANSAWITVGDLTAANLGLATLASPTFTGTATIPTLTVSTSAGIPLGSAASPKLFFTGDTNTGLYSPGADQVALTTGGTGRLFINSSGSVGIGTSSPDTLLHLQSSANNMLYMQSTDSIVDIIGADTTGSTRIRSQAGALTFWTGGNASSSSATSALAAITIDTSQRVGIGTTAPAYPLSVSTVSNVGIGIDNWAAIGSGGASDLRVGGLVASQYTTLGLYTGGSERARIDSSGRLLVGTSTARANFFNSTFSPLIQVETTGNPSLALVGGEAGGDGARLILAHQRSGTLGGNTILNSGDEISRISFQGSDGTEFVEAARIYAEVDGIPGANDMPGRLVFSTTADGASSPTERMRITNGGSVVIADTALRDGFTSHSLQVTGFSLFYQTTSATAASVFTHTASGTQTACLFRQGAPGTTCGSITVNSATSTSYNTSSDYRLKENIVPLTGAIDRIKQLKPSQFNFIVNPTKTVDGFLAHEAQAVVPECVTGAKDEVDDNGDPVYQGIDQSKLVPLLTAALQEAIGRIETLEVEVAALKGA